MISPAARLGVGPANGLQWSRFRKQLDRASHQQEQWLLRRIRACEETTFGRDHHFHEIRTLADFRQRVPVGEYDRFAPYIDAVAAGKTEALVPKHEKLLRFTITTGSTGAPKLNPVTDVWIKQLRYVWGLWGMKLFADHPHHIGKDLLQMAGTWEMGVTPGGYSISMVSALLTRIQNPCLRPFCAIPSDLNDIRDPVVRYYTALRLSMDNPIGWILLMNPGTVVRLAEVGDQFKEDLIRDFRDGTLTERFEISRDLRNRLAPRIQKRKPDEAKRLEQIVERTGHLFPKDYWPEPVIGCWLGGTAGFQSRYLREYFGNSPLRDMGLVSSEGRHTIPVEDDKPEGVPSIASGFYEYMPVSEYGKDFPQVVDGPDLQVGQEYFLVMTTAAGYYRFHIGDIVRCNGFLGEAPLLEFLQKGTRVGDLEGEKLTELQVVEGAEAASRDMGVQLGLVTAVARRLRHEHPRYEFLVEVDMLPEPDVAHCFLKKLDEKLAGLNFLWKARRNEGCLAEPRLVRLPSGTWERYIAAEVDRRGTGDFQYKHPALVLDSDWVEQFEPIDIITLSESHSMI